MDYNNLITNNSSSKKENDINYDESNFVKSDQKIPYKHINEVINDSPYIPNRNNE